MTSNQEDKLSMYYVVKNTCEKYQATWTTNAVFAATYNLWAEKIPLIEANRDIQALGISGVTISKSEKREIMIVNTLFVEKRVQSYANVENNSELLESIKYTASDLKKARDNDVVAMCNIVYTKARANAPAIETYGVTEDIFAKLQNSIAEYSASLPQPKAARSQAKTATENLSKYFKEADNLLAKRLDLDIELFKTTKPEFYSQFKTARIVIATGGFATSVIGCITNTTTGQPMKGATITFVATNGGTTKAAATAPTKPVVKRSANKGKFRASLHENTYRVTVEKIGFKKQELTISVARGESTDLNIGLEKE
ncbi:carboxypeptidase-like regulatory domain-containing protein [Williamwhitmania taraxaci]|uniref:Carboxypeptidase regulatory-like domain-containing protein n=1 Tax=Williamwhitmania taraxaci TaxID=1640674 RepID=A0A1G6SVN9_9BACT|nr:carboxypeptidase-like regulatory domain-containing protein [Williamwhitmania taraxaci]SDD20287.1 Carboxypeptidase regulatory-like domain-containing protein [Williamwhitmania taraxaci]